MVLKSTARPLPGRAARHWLTVLLGTVSGCLALGCQSGPRVQKSVEMVNAERRTLEDRVYALEYDLDLVEAELADARAENDKLSRELYGDKGAPARSGGSRPARPTRSSSGAGSGRSSASPVPRDELIPPEIDAGEPTELGPPRTTPPMAPPELPAGPGGPSGRAVPAAPTIPDDSSSPGSPVPPEAPRAPSVSVPPERSAPTGIPLPPGTAPAAELLELPDRQTEGEEPVGLTGPGNARPAAAVPVTPGSAYLALDATITGGADFDGSSGHRNGAPSRRLSRNLHCDLALSFEYFAARQLIAHKEPQTFAPRWIAWPCQMQRVGLDILSTQQPSDLCFFEIPASHAGSITALARIKQHRRQRSDGCHRTSSFIAEH
ncbi:MAG: hypothetical protein ACKOUR_13615 [Planctomycetota bacterium]